MPALSVRVGPKDIFYAEGSFPGSYPFACTFPTFRAGIGSGFGKTDGTTASIGFSNDAFYARAVYPIKNTWVLEAFYADNFSTGSTAQRIFSLGISYRIFDKKDETK
jgi:hypothetical protein